MHTDPTTSSPAPLVGLAPLALSDGLSVSLAVFQLVFSCVVSLVLWRLSAWQRRYEGIENRLNDMAGRMVDERFRSMGQELSAHVQGLVMALNELRERFSAGATDLRTLAERDQRIELSLHASVDALKDYIRDHAAGKTDLEKHEAAVDRKLAHVEHRIGELAGTVAVLAERVKA